MKILSLADTHGRTIWNKIVKKEKDADLIIFLGDYFDTHEGISARQQIDNFKDIINFKKKNLDKVILLTGNHDCPYIKGFGETYSGYEKFHANEIIELLDTVLKDNLLQMCYKHDKYVFTHAGVTKTWAEANDVDINNIEQSINDLFKNSLHAFRFTIGDNYDLTGDDITQPPIWVRPESLVKDKLDGVTYVIGHTPVIQMAQGYDIIFTDCLGNKEPEYLTIIDGEPRFNKI